MVVLKLLITVDASVSLFHMLCDFVIISLLFEGYVPLLAPYPGRNMSPPPARTNHVSPPPGCQRQSCSQCSLANGGGTWPFLDRTSDAVEIFLPGFIVSCKSERIIKLDYL